MTIAAQLPEKIVPLIAGLKKWSALPLVIAGARTPEIQEPVEISSILSPPSWKPGVASWLFALNGTLSVESRYLQLAALNRRVEIHRAHGRWAGEGRP